MGRLLLAILSRMDALRKLPPVALYAIAMAYVEAAAVPYLREMRGIDNLLEDLPTTLDRCGAVAAAGIAVVLYTFTADALGALPGCKRTAVPAISN